MCDFLNLHFSLSYIEIVTLLWSKTVKYLSGWSGRKCQCVKSTSQIIGAGKCHLFFYRTICNDLSTNKFPGKNIRNFRLFRCFFYYARTRKRCLHCDALRHTHDTEQVCASILNKTYVVHNYKRKVAMPFIPSYFFRKSISIADEKNRPNPVRTMLCL